MLQHSEKTLGELKTYTKNAQHLIVDYDGTVADLSVDWSIPRRQICERFSSLQRSGLFCETDRLDRIEYKLLRNTDIPLHNVLEVRHNFEAKYIQEAKPIEPVVSCLRKARAKGKFLYCVSNNLNATVLRGLQQLELLELFSAILTPDITGYIKPDVDCVRSLLSDISLTAANTIVIGDSIVTDGQLSNNLGFPFINVKTQ